MTINHSSIYPPELMLARPYQVTAQDLDGLGHVNNVQYLHWCEQVAWQHSENLGATLKLFQQEDNALVAHVHHLQYLRSCTVPDTLCLSTWIGERTPLKLRRYYAFYQISDAVYKQLGHDSSVWSDSYIEQSGPKVFEGYTDWVSIQLSSGKPRRMCDALKRCYQIK